jgi:hypothetical protein
MEQLELEPVLGHAQHAETLLPRHRRALRGRSPPARSGATPAYECGEHRGVAAVEVAISEASRHIAEDGGAQGRRLALFSERLAPGAGKRPHELGIGGSAISLRLGSPVPFALRLFARVSVRAGTELQLQNL